MINDCGFSSANRRARQREIELCQNSAKFGGPEWRAAADIAGGCARYIRGGKCRTRSFVRQARRIVLWCEASGMVPQLQRVAHEYGVPVKSSGGFDSLTVKHALSRQLGADKPATVLHIGDFDPSGEVMFDALAEDVGAFAAGYGHEVRFIRLAVTSGHIAQYGLPTAPPKESTHQARKQMVETVQAEALDPATLGRIVQQAIAGCMDEQVLDDVMGAEDEEQQRLVYHLESFGGLQEGNGH